MTGPQRVGWVWSRYECRQVARLVQSYLDGEVDGLTADRVGAHLEECRRCGLEAETYAEIKHALARRCDVSAAAVDRLRAFGERLIAEDGEEESRDD